MELQDKRLELQLQDISKLALQIYIHTYIHTFHTSNLSFYLNRYIRINLDIHRNIYQDTKVYRMQSIYLFIYLSISLYIILSRYIEDKDLTRFENRPLPLFPSSLHTRSTSSEVQGHPQLEHVILQKKQMCCH